MTMPTNPRADNALEARLTATFERATLRAAEEIATGDVLLRRPARPTGLRRVTTRPVLAAVLAVLAIAVGFGVVRLVSTTATVAASPSPSVPSANPSSPSAPPSAPLSDSTVYPVGAGAAERIAAATDTTSFVISGWVLGTEPPCPWASPDALWDHCPVMRLHPGPAGGPAVEVYSVNGPAVPSVDSTSARQVTVRVHTHDAACTEHCLDLAVMTEFLDIGQQVAIPMAVLDGNPLVLEETAISTAIAALGATNPVDYFVVDARRGPVSRFLASTDIEATRTVWSITLRETGFVEMVSEKQFLIDDKTGEILKGDTGLFRSSSGMPPADTTLPEYVDDVPVLTAENAQRKIATASESFLVGGWIQGIDRRLCQDPSGGQATQLWSPCAGIWLHPDAAGGLPIQITIPADVAVALPRPDEGTSVPVVLQLHAESLPATDPNIGQAAILDRVVWRGTGVDSLKMGSTPVGSISLADAQKVAKAYTNHRQQVFVYGAKITIGAFDAIDGGAFSGPGTNDRTWVWALFYTDGTETSRDATVVIVTFDGRPIVGMPFP